MLNLFVHRYQNSNLMVCCQQLSCKRIQTWNESNTHSSNSTQTDQNIEMSTKQYVVYRNQHQNTYDSHSKNIYIERRMLRTYK